MDTAVAPAVTARHAHSFDTCSSESCRDSTLGPAAAQVPLPTGEMGENTRAHSFIDRVMKWFDDRGLSCLGWAGNTGNTGNTWNTWSTWNCSSGPALISGYDSTPTAFGIGPRDHLRALNH